MSVQTEIDRIITHVRNAHAKVAAKGGTTAEPYLIANLAGAIETIPEASDPVLQSKTVSPSTSQQTVTPDSGYDGLSKVTVNAMATATQATPGITVSSGGLITASATQTAGYVAAGTKSATKQLTTQEAQTITPGTSDKTIASGKYLTGTQTIKGDANLVADNIKSGVSIFGVAGSYEGSGGGGTGGGTYTGQITFSGPAPKGFVVYYCDANMAAQSIQPTKKTQFVVAANTFVVTAGCTVDVISGGSKLYTYSGSTVFHITGDNFTLSAEM